MSLILIPPLWRIDDVPEHCLLVLRDQELEQIASEVLDQTVGRPGCSDEGRSVYGVLAAHLASPTVGRGLAPSPAVDEALTRLVELLTTTFERDADPSFHWEVVRSISDRIAADRELRRRAQTIRTAAGIAESLMEVHHARRLRTSPSGPRRRFHDGSSAIRHIFGSFPYLDNYRLLVEAERAGLRQIESGHAGAAREFGPLDRVAFCGAGALPLTGILLALESGPEVVLVEIDPRVGELIDKVLYRLHHAGVVESSRVSIQIMNAADLDPAPFDLIAVASLVSNDVVASLADGIAALGPTGPILLARSALGLTSLLAYEAIDIDAVAESGLAHLGTVAPAGQVSSEPSLTGLAVRPNGSLLHTAPRSVLNTSEFFAHPAAAAVRRR